MADLRELIEAHRAAVMVDETMFDDDGECIDETGAGASGETEKRAFIALVDAPCLSHDDVAAKLHYFVNGTIGERSSLIVYLLEYSGGDADLIYRLLKSLVPGGASCN